MSRAHDPIEPRDAREPADAAEPGARSGDEPLNESAPENDAVNEPAPVNEAVHDARDDDGTALEDRPAAEGGLDLEQMDEDAVRRLFQESVRDIEPSAGSLEYLRHAVPARRARRRNAMVGAAAAVIACGVAVPTMLHADFVPGGEKPMHNAGHSEDHVPQEQRTGGGDQGEGPAGSAADEGQSGENRGGTETGAPSSGSSSVPDPTSSLGPLSPTCTRLQLGDTAGGHQPADAQGTVYGAFRVVNTSTDSCTVEGDGIVLVTAQGSADSTMIQVLDHTTGDAATGLPDPVNLADEVVLEPGAAYEVRFAWVPSADGGCSTSTPPPGGTGGEGGDGTQSGGQTPMGTAGSEADAGDSGGTSGGEGGDGEPAPGGSEGSGSGGLGTGGTDGGGSTGGGSTGGGGEDPAPGSVLITHTPEAGEPAADSVLIEGACAGTVYRTGVLPAA